MITVPDGYVALQHHNSNGCIVKMEQDGTIYRFVPQHNISMAYVKEEHVDRLLQQKVKACCGKNKLKFFRASQININLWATGDRHGEVYTE